MDIFRTIEDAAGGLDRTILTIGNFDGLHLGHQTIISTVRELARRHDAKAVMMTFEPHPVAYFRPELAPRRLSPPAMKFDLASRYGLDAVVALEFGAELSSTSAEDFVVKILHEALHARVVVVGEGFRFGKGRAGSTDTIAEVGGPLGMEVIAHPPVEWAGEVVSSTRVREALAKGAIDDVTALLGRPYVLRGEVVPGDQRGRVLGFPTANIAADDMALPLDGVYATVLDVPGSGRLESITNIGLRPTFGGDERKVEAFVLSEVTGELDLYGQQVDLELHAFVREERKFDSPQALIAQVTSDIDRVKAFFKER
jgi:riboflavin kinase / FMN adenylyltransferase